MKSAVFGRQTSGLERNQKKLTLTKIIDVFDKDMCVSLRVSSLENVDLLL